MQFFKGLVLAVSAILSWSYEICWDCQHDGKLFSLMVNRGLLVH